MSTAQGFHPHPQVVYQAVEGEVIIIHLDTGNYNSLPGVAAWIWERLAAGWSKTDLVRHLAVCCPEVPAGGLENETWPFVDQLLRENLLVQAPKAVAAAEPSEKPASICYAPPVLQKFSDLQDLLLADATHEVSEAGWPQLPPELST
jgi:hypothetical protein